MTSSRMKLTKPVETMLKHVLEYVVKVLKEACKEACKDAHRETYNSTTKEIPKKVNRRVSSSRVITGRVITSRVTTKMNRPSGLVYTKLIPHPLTKVVEVGHFDISKTKKPVYRIDRAAVLRGINIALKEGSCVLRPIGRPKGGNFQSRVCLLLKEILSVPGEPRIWKTRHTPSGLLQIIIDTKLIGHKSETKRKEEVNGC